MTTESNIYSVTEHDIKRNIMYLTYDTYHKANENAFNGLLEENEPNIYLFTEEEWLKLLQYMELMSKLKNNIKAVSLKKLVFTYLKTNFPELEKAGQETLNIIWVSL